MKKIVQWCFVLTCLCTVSLVHTGCFLFVKKKSRWQIQKEKRERSRAKKNAQAREAIAKLSNGASCDEVIELAGVAKKLQLPVRYKSKKWSRGRIPPTKKELVDDKFFPIADALARCKKWDYVFGSLFQFGGKYLPHLMGKLKDKGYKVHKEYNSWVEEQPHPFYQKITNNMYSMAKWLRKVGTSQQKKRHCQVWANATQRTYQKASSGSLAKRYNRNQRYLVRRVLVGQLFEGECREHIGLVRKMLSDRPWRNRRQACAILGKWGKARDVRLLRTVVRTDIYSKFIRKGVNSHRIWPVRERCRSALGALSLSRR